MGPGPAGANQGLQHGLEILHIGGAALVQDHEIDCQALQLPVFARAQEYAHDAGVLDLLDAHQHDRQITGDAL